MYFKYHKILVKTLILIIAVILCFTLEGWGRNQKGGNNPLKILFVANSYVYVNNLPSILESIANMKHANSLTAEMIVLPGGTLQKHWEKGIALTRIKNESWDYVILQEQSTFGYRVINGKREINQPDNFYKYARLFNDEIKMNNANTAFLLTWARKYTPKHQKKITNAYMNIAKELDAKVFPVGLAWQKIRNRYEDIELYSDDSSHPSPKGSYLTASVIYSELFNKSPVGLINNVQVYPTTWKGKVIKDTTETINVPLIEATNLQRIAWETHNELADSGGYIFIKRTNKQSPNEIIIKEHDFANRLSGLWRGPLFLFDSPTVMNIKFKFENDILQFSCDFIYTQKSDTISVQIIDSEIRDGHFSFSIKGPNDEGISSFNGLLLDNKLMGISEYRIKNKPVHCSGFWKLEKSINAD